MYVSELEHPLWILDVSTYQLSTYQLWTGAQYSVHCDICDFLIIMESVTQSRLIMCTTGAASLICGGNSNVLVIITLQTARQI